MNYPTISVAIATYNSEKTIERVLSSIRKQNYPQKDVEILVIDGGSTDSTLNIAKKYSAKIIKNAKVDFVNAKFLGYKKAKGRYLVMIDSDEEIESKDSFKLKINSFKLDDNVKVVTSSGYKSPKNYPKINSYINEYGDPFSYFMYKSSRDSRFFLNELKTRYAVVKENKECVVFDFSKTVNAPFIELISMSAMIDLVFVKKNFPEIIKNLSAHTHLFYLLNSNGNFVAITKNDPIIHYSVHSFKKYLKKISSRVKNNIFGTGMGVAGFSGRQKYYSGEYDTKKFLFVPYSFSLIFSVLDSIKLAKKHKNNIYLIHFLLCLYTSISIIYFYCKKTLKIKTDLVGYAK